MMFLSFYKEVCPIYATSPLYSFILAISRLFSWIRISFYCINIILTSLLESNREVFMLSTMFWYFFSSVFRISLLWSNLIYMTRGTYQLLWLLQRRRRLALLYRRGVLHYAFLEKGVLILYIHIYG